MEDTRSRKRRHLQTKKLNCWEFKKCGREPGGEKAKELGECSTATTVSLDGVNGGINGGRICWLVAGTYGKYKAAYADCISVQSMSSCFDCEFHKIVLKEEGFAYADDEITRKLHQRTYCYVP